MADEFKTTGVFPAEYQAQMRLDARNFDDTRIPTDLAWPRFDASIESAFVARQLESIRPGVYKVQYIELIGSQLVPANTEDDPGAAAVTITIVDQAGQVLVSNDMTQATPMVEVKTSQQSATIFSIRQGYQYSLQEARAALMAKRPLVADKAMACREQMERKLDNILFLGESTVGITGLLNQSGALTYTPVVGLGGGFTFASKSADEVLKDLNGAPSQVVTNSLGIEVPDTVVFPYSINEYLNSTRVGDGTSMSILTYFKGNNTHIRNYYATPYSETAGASSSPRTVFYKNNQIYLEYALPQPFEQLPPQPEGFMVTTLCHMRTTGVLLKRPKSMIYLDRQ